MVNNIIDSMLTRQWYVQCLLKEVGNVWQEEKEGRSTGSGE